MYVYIFLNFFIKREPHFGHLFMKTKNSLSNNISF